MSGPQLVAALIGYGAVGQTVSGMVARGDDRAKYEAVAGVRLLDSADELLRTPATLVVEAAGQAAVRELGPRTLAAGKDLMIISTGALADPAVLRELQQTAARTGRRIFIPSGSVGALDAIASASVGEITEVAHIIRKPPRAFTPEQLGGRDGVQTVFDGMVSEGAALFPENANAATAVGLAGIGPARTRLRIVADPALTRNVQEIDVTGTFGHLQFQIENVPSANPKTSRLVALSVIKALRNMTSTMVVGV